MKVRFMYRRSEELQGKLLAETGELPDAEGHLEIELADLRPEDRQLIVAAWGLPKGGKYPLEKLAKPTIVKYNGQITCGNSFLTADEEVDLDFILCNARERIEQKKAIEALRPEAERIQAQIATERAAAAEKFEAEEAARKAAEAEREEKQAVLLAEKTAWVKEHGSDLLRAAVAAGYDCQRRYLRERAALEHPRAYLDLDRELTTSETGCPSEEAFDFACEVGGKVVEVENEDCRYEAVLVDWHGYQLVYSI